VAANRKSLRTQIDECHALIDKEIEAGTERPARLTLLKSKLESLMDLFRQENANSALAVENAELKRRVAELESPKQTVPMSDSSSDSSLIDATVAQMIARHNAGMAENKSVLQVPVPVTRSEPVTRPALVETDPDLVV